MENKGINQKHVEKISQSDLNFEAFAQKFEQEIREMRNEDRVKLAERIFRIKYNMENDEESSRQ